MDKYSKLNPKMKVFLTRAIVFVYVTIADLIYFIFRNFRILNMYLPPRMLNLIKNKSTKRMCIAVIQALTTHAN